MPSTPLGLPYPSGSQPVNIPGDMGALASATDDLFDPVLGEWVSYAPTWTGSGGNPAIGNGTIVGKYRQVGKSVDFSIMVTMGSTTTYGSGQWSLTLPFAPVLNGGNWFFIGAARTSVTYFLGGEIVTPGSATMTLRCLPTTAGNNYVSASPTVPVTWATGNILAISGSYEAA